MKRILQLLSAVFLSFSFIVHVYAQEEVQNLEDYIYHIVIPSGETFNPTDLVSWTDGVNSYWQVASGEVFSFPLTDEPFTVQVREKGTGTSNEEVGKVVFTIVPTLFDSDIRITSDQPLGRIEIHSISGQKFAQYETNDVQVTLTPNLQKGWYIVTCLGKTVKVYKK